MMNQRIFDDFDTFSSEYRDIHNRNIHISGADSDYFSRYKVAEVHAREIGSEIKDILDFGCGDGNSFRFFGEFFPNARLHGLDVSEKSIEEARLTFGNRHSFSVFDGQHIPYENDSFDTVFVACVFHHIHEQLHDKILSELFRVLRPGGRLYFFEHNPINPLTRKIVRDCVFDKDAVLITAKRARSMIKEAGFQCPRIRFTIFFPRHRAFRPLLIFERYLTWLPLGGQYYIRTIK